MRRPSLHFPDEVRIRDGLAVLHGSPGQFRRRIDRLLDPVLSPNRGETNRSSLMAFCVALFLSSD